MVRGKIVATVGLALVAALVVSTATTSFSTGITRAKGLPAEGCVCHGENSKGTPSKDVEIYFHIDGNPLVFEKGKTYNLTFGANHTDVPINPDGNKGGFNLKVSDGKLAPAPGWEKFVQVEGLEATHQKEGDKTMGRHWALVWTAPSSDDKPVIFTLFLNTVNGDDAPSEKDHWNGVVRVLLNKPGAAVGAAGNEVDPEKVGVNWLAHWVGIVSFAAVAATLLVYYFVLKYGESVHTTDHRDRKEK